MPFRTLDLNLLKVFEALMTEGSVTRAANALVMTQPAVSNALARLRAKLKYRPVVFELIPTARVARGFRRTSWLMTRYPPFTPAAPRLCGAGRLARGCCLCLCGAHTAVREVS